MSLRRNNNCYVLSYCVFRRRLPITVDSVRVVAHPFYNMITPAQHTHRTDKYRCRCVCVCVCGITALITVLGHVASRTRRKIPGRAEYPCTRVLTALIILTYGLARDLFYREVVSVKIVNGKRLEKRKVHISPPFYRTDRQSRRGEGEARIKEERKRKSEKEREGGGGRCRSG